MSASATQGGHSYSTAQCRTGWPPSRVKIPFRKVWLTHTAGVPCSNAANTGERKTWTQSEFCTWQNSFREQELPKMYIYCTNPGDGQTSCKAKFGWPALSAGAVTKPRYETRWNLQGCPKLANWSQPLVGRSSPYYEDMWRRYCRLTIFSDYRYKLMP